MFVAVSIAVPACARTRGGKQEGQRCYSRSRSSHRFVSSSRERPAAPDEDPSYE
jgi:hypothetical protein